MIYLVEFEAYDREKGSVVTERFATDGYTNSATDDPPHAHWEERVINPGNFEQSVFSDGTTSGDAEVGYGYVEIAIGDDGVGNNADRLATHAVDGRPLRIWSLDSAMSPLATRRLVFSGVMEQIEVDWTKATIRFLDRLDDLRVPIQATVYLGTTTDGTKTDAEGRPDDLKDKPKPLAWGVNRNVPGVLSNIGRLILDFASNGVTEFREVRDAGVKLTAGTNYATTAELAAATVPDRTYATCRAAGQVRLGFRPIGAVTADIVEGAAGARSVARVVRRILERSGFVAGVDFDADDLEALHAKNAAEVGIWIGADERDILPVVAQLLDSVGAYVIPDEAGKFRFDRIEAPVAGPYPVLDPTFILDDGQGLERLATNDDRQGVPVYEVTANYAPVWVVQSLKDLEATNTTDEIKALASKQYRTVIASDPTVQQIHLRAGKLSIDTLFAYEADALAEANRRLAMHKVPRANYRVPLPPEMDKGWRLGSLATLRVPRFDLSAGKPMVVIGREAALPSRGGESVTAGIVTLTLFG